MATLRHLAAVLLILFAAASRRRPLKSSRRTSSTSRPSTRRSGATAACGGGGAVFLGRLLRLPRHLRAPRPRLLYSYAHAATGSRRASPEQAAHVEAQPGVLAVHPDQALQLHTTHTPAFLHLTQASGLLPAAAAASGGASSPIVGVLDTGIYPIGRGSFAPTDGLGPPPASFSGGCVSTASFNASAYCNNKLIGAKCSRPRHR